MVEAGDVDWANHDDNLDSSIGAVLSGDDAFRAIADWVDRHDCWHETAVIVTADHGHFLVLDDPGRSFRPSKASGSRFKRPLSDTRVASMPKTGARYPGSMRSRLLPAIRRRRSDRARFHVLSASQLAQRAAPIPIAAPAPSFAKSHPPAGQRRSALREWRAPEKTPRP